MSLQETSQSFKIDWNFIAKTTWKLRSRKIHHSHWSFWTRLTSVARIQSRSRTVPFRQGLQPSPWREECNRLNQDLLKRFPNKVRSSKNFLNLTITCQVRALMSRWKKSPHLRDSRDRPQIGPRPLTLSTKIRILGSSNHQTLDRLPKPLWAAATQSNSKAPNSSPTRIQSEPLLRMLQDGRTQIRRHQKIDRSLL